MLNIPQYNPDEWIAALPTYAANSINALSDAGMADLEIAELWLSPPGAHSTAGFGGSDDGQNFLKNVKAEFRLLCCGDPKYASLRAEIEKYADSGALFISSIVSVAVASAVGAATATIVPVIALLFRMVTKVGINAWCREG